MLLTGSSGSSNISVNIPEQEENATAKRRKLDSHGNASTRNECNPAATPDNSTHHAQQAKLVIQIEVDGRQLGRRHLSSERRRIFESAVKLVDRMSRGEHSDLHESIAPGESARELFDVEAPQTPPAEILYMLLPGRHTHSYRLYCVLIVSRASYGRWASSY